MKGAKPTPREVRRKRNPRFRDLPNVVAGREAPRMPAGLTERMKTAWRTCVDDLTRSGVLDAADWAVVEAFAVAVGRAREARAIVNKEGLLHVNAQGRVAHPALGIEERAWKEVRQLAEQLPLSPWGRARLGIELGKTDFEDLNKKLDAEAGTPPKLHALG